MGKHGSNVDTLMLAHFDASHKKITLISVPRDLYVQERKINSVYAAYGIKEQARVVGEVLGLVVHNYILVDMYVFRDLIDLLGGVDIVLEEPLVDPSYKVCEDGLCSTLYYEAGPHHLDGTAALRVARSRHSTSDYSRAERQQLILGALLDELKAMDLSDLSTLASLMRTGLAATESNLTLQQTLVYSLKYRDFSLSAGNVISTANVLAANPVPVDYVTSRKTEVCELPGDPATCKTQYFIDTLGPVNGNWDAIKWYVQQVLNQN